MNISARMGAIGEPIKFIVKFSNIIVNTRFQEVKEFVNGRRMDGRVKKDVINMV